MATSSPGILNVIRARLGLGPAVTPQDSANAAANTLGGTSGDAVKALRRGTSSVDEQLNRDMGMPPPPKGQQ